MPQAVENHALPGEGRQLRVLLQIFHPQEAGLQARKAGREAAAKAEKGMTDNVADKIAQYSKSSGMALISGDLPGIGAKDIVR